jgi:hypothetical protein
MESGILALIQMVLNIHIQRLELTVGIGRKGDLTISELIYRSTSERQ